MGDSSTLFLLHSCMMLWTPKKRKEIKLRNISLHYPVLRFSIDP